MAYDGRKHEGEVEADVFLRVGHTDLANEGADVGEEVEVLERVALVYGRGERKRARRTM